MQELTTQEKKLLENFRIKLQSEDVRNAIAISSYLISEIEYQFGCDIAEFIVGYQSGLLQHCASITTGVTPVLALAGNAASDGFSEMQTQINNEMISSVYNKVSFDPSSELANELSALVNKMVDSIK